MIALLLKLFQLFGSMPSLERYFNLLVNGKMLSQLFNLAMKIASCSSVQEALDKISNDPELSLEFQRALMLAETEYLKEQLRDKQNARTRDLEIRRLHGANRRANIMLVLAAIGLILCVLSLLFFKTMLSAESVGVISTIAAVFAACLRDAYSFEFGGTGSDKPPKFKSNQKLVDLSEKIE